jgi:hypothetical protein
MSITCTPPCGHVHTFPKYRGRQLERWLALRPRALAAYIAVSASRPPQALPQVWSNALTWRNAELTGQQRIAVRLDRRRRRSGAPVLVPATQLLHRLGAAARIPAVNRPKGLCRSAFQRVAQATGDAEANDSRFRSSVDVRLCSSRPSAVMVISNQQITLL